MSKQQAPASSKRSARSGEHPAVQGFRAKLDSVDSSTAAALSKLDLELDECREKLKTPVPPKA